MNDTHSINEQFLRNMQSGADKIAASDKGKIGETVKPEVTACNYTSKTASLRYAFHPWMLNCNNVMHGGSVALLMDTSMGLLSSACQDDFQPTPTVSMQITYLNPIPLSDHIMVDVKINAIKSKLVYACATMYEEHRPDIPLASAVGEYYRTRR